MNVFLYKIFDKKNLLDQTSYPLFCCYKNQFWGQNVIKIYDSCHQVPCSQYRLLMAWWTLCKQQLYGGQSTNLIFLFWDKTGWKLYFHSLVQKVHVAELSCMNAVMASGDKTRIFWENMAKSIFLAYRSDLKDTGHLQNWLFDIINIYLLYLPWANRYFPCAWYRLLIVGVNFSLTRWTFDHNKTSIYVKISSYTISILHTKLSE